MNYRGFYAEKIKKMLQVRPIVALLGPRQIGKTTLARLIKADHYLDLENPQDEALIHAPEFFLRQKQGLIVIDEVQRAPSLFPFLRYWVDHHPEQRFLLLGSASQDLVNRSSESLAGRISYLEIGGFNLEEVDAVNDWERLWQRGSYPKSFLALEDLDSLQWRQDYIKTFLERDIGQLGISLPSPALRRLWTLLANASSQMLNYAELGRLFDLSDVGVRKYIEVLEATLMIRTLRPWHANVNKRQVKKPKVYIRDSGLMHALLQIQDIRLHPLMGASWETFALEQVIQLLAPRHPLLTPEHFYFWRSHQGEEIDLFFQFNQMNIGLEIKFNLRPKLTHSMKVAKEVLKLDHLLVITPEGNSYELAQKVTVTPISQFLSSISKILGGALQ